MLVDFSAVLFFSTIVYRFLIRATAPLVSDVKRQVSFSFSRIFSEGLGSVFLFSPTAAQWFSLCALSFFDGILVRTHRFFTLTLLSPAVSTGKESILYF